MHENDTHAALATRLTFHDLPGSRVRYGLELNFPVQSGFISVMVTWLDVRIASVPDKS